MTLEKYKSCEHQKCQLSIIILNIFTCADPESFVREGPNLMFCFFVVFFRGVRLQKPQKAGKYQPASKTPLKWLFAGGTIMDHIKCWLGSFVIFRGYGSFFRGGGGGVGTPLSPPPPGSVHIFMCYTPPQLLSN